MTNEMVLEYEPYIYGIAKKFNGYKNKEDLIQVGYMGLVMALKNYKEDNNIKFSTYAYKYIYGEMCKLVREDKSIKLNRNMTKLRNSLENARSILYQKLNREPTIKELSTFLELEPNIIEETLKINLNVMSIDMQVNSDNENNLYEVIPSSNMDINTLVALKESLENLTDEDKKMLNMSFNMTEKEVGQEFDMNQVQVSRRLKKIKQRIKKEML